MIPKKRRKRSPQRLFDAQRFLDSTGSSKKVANYEPGAIVFAQGDPALSVMYVQHGGVRLSVIAETGKEAVVALLGPGDFFGEGCLAGQPVRMATATAITETVALIVEKRKMLQLLHDQSGFSDRFITHMLARNIR